MELESYGEKLVDEEFWGSYVKSALSNVPGFTEQVVITGGFPGSYPTFVVTNGKESSKIVVKLFIQGLFEGPRIFKVEKNALAFIQTLSIVNIPKVISHGKLDNDEKDIFYLVMDFMPGVCVREVLNSISQNNYEVIARDVGRLVHQLHQTSPISELYDLEGQVNFEMYMTERRKEVTQNHHKWKMLNSKMISQFPKYFKKFDESWKDLFCHENEYSILHGDLTEDHIFIQKLKNEQEEQEEDLENVRYEISGIIDFGDVRIGHPIFEVIPAFFGVFFARKDLLKIFLESYGWDEKFKLKIESKLFRYYLMCFTLLFEFNVLLRHKDEIKQFESLESLEDYFFQI